MRTSMGRDAQYEEPWLHECLFSPSGDSYFGALSKFNKFVKAAGGPEGLYRLIGVGGVLKSSESWVRDLLQAGKDFARTTGTANLKSGSVGSQYGEVWYEGPNSGSVYGTTYAAGKKKSVGLVSFLRKKRKT